MGAKKLNSQLTLRLPDDLREWLTNASAAERRSASNYIVGLIEAARSMAARSEPLSPESQIKDLDERIEALEAQKRELEAKSAPLSKRPTVGVRLRSVKKR